MLAASIITRFVATIPVNFKFQFHIMNVRVCVCVILFAVKVFPVDSVDMSLSCLNVSSHSAHMM
jgi:hypothetical protein